MYIAQIIRMDSQKGYKVMGNWIRRNVFSILALLTFFGGNSIAAYLITEYVPFDPATKNAPTVSVSPTIPVGESQAFGPRIRNNRVNTLRDCEDSPRVPCITRDENEWRLVTSYKPYTFVTLFRCATEDSENCYWDARKRGNHKGNSFVTGNVNGQHRVFYFVG